MAERQPPDGVPAASSNPWGLCTPFMTELPISGAVIAVIDRVGHRSTVAVTDPVAARWDELELELGTGPLTDATVESAPQLVSDAREAALNPLIGAHLVALGVRALFAFPLTLGMATVGVVGLYRTRAGPLTSDNVSVAISLARSASAPAVREALQRARSEGDVEPEGSGPGLRREVHQATGMLSAQLDVSTTEAFARLRGYAISSERSITAIALDIVNGTIDGLDLD